ncbi:MAG: hypothetical protein FWE03_00770 [Firmicutes bacterium]|nr:hypothetical protein [Bacillota bacterium]
MSLIPAICTQCGANIQVDSTKETGICNHCQTAFITEKVIHNHNSYTTQYITKNIFKSEKTEFAELIEKGMIYIKLKDWSNAKLVFHKSIDEKPGDYRGYLGLILCDTKNYSDILNTSHHKYLEKALIVASDDEKRLIQEHYTPYRKLLDEQHYINNKKPAKKVVSIINNIPHVKSKISIILSFLPLLIGIIFIIIGINAIITSTPLAEIFFFVGAAFCIISIFTISIFVKNKNSVCVESNNEFDDELDKNKDEYNKHLKLLKIKAEENQDREFPIC